MTKFWMQVPTDGTPVFFQSNTDEEHELASGVTSCFEINQEAYYKACNPLTGEKNYVTD